jgi:hypothetical protein
MNPLLQARRLVSALAIIVLSVALAAAPERTDAASSARAGTLPADWPARVPVPPGALQGSTGSAGQWSVLILANGSAADVLRSAHDFYAAAGFASQSDAILQDASYRIILVAENRDHSASETNLTVAVTSLPATQPPTAPAEPAQALDPVQSAGAISAHILPSQHLVRLALARRVGLRVAFTAPAAARSVIVRGFRILRAGRRTIGSRSATLHPGRNVVALDSPAVRHRLQPGRYQLEVILRAAKGSHSTPTRITIAVR